MHHLAIGALAVGVPAAALCAGWVRRQQEQGGGEGREQAPHGGQEQAWPPAAWAQPTLAAASFMYSPLLVLP